MRINDIAYHVLDVGRGQPVLLLHGFTGSASTWEPLAAQWGDTQRCIMPDLLGHGATDAPDDAARYAMPAAAADLSALLSGWVGQTPVHVVGYSMGGRLALYFALHYAEQVRSLVLESASPGLRTESERVTRRASDEMLAARIEREGVPAFVDHWEQIPLFASQARLPLQVRLHERQQRLKNRAVGLANSLRGMGTGAQPSLWELLPTLSVYTLILAGALDDKFVGIAREMAAIMPHAQTQIIADAGHTVHLEQPVVFGGTLRAFWAAFA